MTRQGLYTFIEGKRREYGLTAFPLNISDSLLPFLPSVTVTSIDFETIAFCGFLYKRPSGKSLIILNTRRNQAERNFDLAHELVHFWLDNPPPENKQKSLRELILNAQTQDSYLEWRANEGAAELLMPFKRLLPDFYSCGLSALRRSDPNRSRLISRLAFKYGVTPAMIEIRLLALKSELCQYSSSLFVEEIQPASRTPVHRVVGCRYPVLT